VAKKHRTWHSADAIDGKVAVACSCGWKTQVAVAGLTWAAAMERIYAARDEHEEKVSHPK
jgi:hypothetical protein